MKRILALIVAPLTLAGALSLGPAEPAAADTVSVTTSRAICQWFQPSGWVIGSYRTVHYGTAHVTQCAYWSGSFSWQYVRCGQYVWNVPNPYWDWYRGEAPNIPYCW